ncbi:MAG TPA: peptidylprolyl isomerase [bacterium]|nr:peptidylprolyl isomerase [bacterium]
MTRILFFIVTVLIAVSCGSFKDEEIIYVFKGEAVSVSDFKAKYVLWLRQSGLADSDEMRRSYLFNDLSERLLYETGLKEGVENIPEVKIKIDNFRKNTIIEYMKKRAKKEIYAIDDEAVRTYYVEHKDKFIRDKLYRLYAVRVSSKKTAEDIVEQLRKGSSIRMLSTRFSNDEMLSRNNGDWGLFSEEVMDELWKKDALSGLPGEILGPYLDSDNFYTIIEIAGFAYKRHLSFNLAYPLIIEELVGESGGEKWDRYRDLMIKEYGAKINMENLNWE